MPVKAFVRKDADHLLPPEHSSEVSGAIGLLQRLFHALNQDSVLYYVIANLYKPQADLLVLTEMGIGVVELKHNYGQLRLSGQTWMANTTPIKAGSDSKSYVNPRDQVQDYAKGLRRKLAPTLEAWWKLTGLTDKLRIQSAVCFTNPNMRIAPDIRTAIMAAADADYSRLGRFDLLQPAQFPDWVAALRFEVSTYSNDSHRWYRLDAVQLHELLKQFHGVEWPTAQALMATNHAYGYLIYHTQNNELAVFPLYKLDIQIGRSASRCVLALPGTYGKVSRLHAQIACQGDEVRLMDLKSTHGSYRNGEQVRSAVTLNPGDQITLGGPRPEPGIFACRFERQLPTEAQDEDRTRSRVV